MKPETDIERWERYLHTEVERLAGTEHDEAMHEVDNCLDVLTKLGRFTVDESNQANIDKRIWYPSAPDRVTRA